MSISQTILTYKNKSKAIWDNGIHTLVIIHIYGSISISLLFCNHQDTASDSLEM